MNTKKAILERREKPRNKPTDKEAMDPELELIFVELELEAEKIKIMGFQGFVSSIPT